MIVLKRIKSALLICLMILISGIGSTAYATVMNCDSGHCPHHNASMQGMNSEAPPESGSESGLVADTASTDHGRCIPTLCNGLAVLTIQVSVRANHIPLTAIGHEITLRRSKNVVNPDRPPNV